MIDIRRIFWRAGVTLTPEIRDAINSFFKYKNCSHLILASATGRLEGWDGSDYPDESVEYWCDGCKRDCGISEYLDLVDVIAKTCPDKAAGIAKQIFYARVERDLNNL